MADGTQIGKAYVQIIPSAQGITGKVQEILDPEGQKAGTSLGSSLTKFAVRAITAGGLTAAVKKTLNFGAEFEQNLGGTEAVFGKYAKNIQSTASEAYKNMGLSASDYMATANKMGSLFQGSGIEQQKSLEMTSMAMQRAADVASVMGIDTTMAMESIAGAAKGNFTMMDNLGVAMNATTLKAYALEKGINFDWNTASNAEKAEIAMKMFMDRTTQYAGNFARESEETFSGSFGAMKASAQDFMTALTTGEGLGSALNNLTNTISVFVNDNLIPMLGEIVSNSLKAIMLKISEFSPELGETLGSIIENIKSIATDVGDLISSVLDSELFKTSCEAIATAIDTVLSVLGDVIEYISNFKDESNLTVPIVTALATAFVTLKTSMAIKSAFTSLISVTGTLKTGVLALFAAIKAHPFIAIASVVVGVVTLIVKNWDWIKEKAIALWNKIKEVWNGIKDAISNAWTTVKTKTTEVWNGIKNTISDIVNKIKSIFTDLIGKMFSVGKDILKGLWNGIKSMAGWVVDKVKGIGSSILSGIKGIFGIKSPSKEFFKIGEYLNLGLANGITENLRPISQAMDQLQAETMRDFDTDVMWSVGSSVGKFNKPTQMSFRDTQTTKPLELNLVLGGKNFKAFVDDISDTQNRKIELELAY